MFHKYCKDLDNQTDAKYDHNHWEFSQFASFDNGMIDSIYSNFFRVDDPTDHLAEQELIHHLRKITKEMEFLLDFEFAKFWAFIVKNQ